jgi:hypothetical protein
MLNPKCSAQGALIPILSWWQRNENGFRGPYHTINFGAGLEIWLPQTMI